MRARKRRSVFNTISAAMLEVSIMGLFVILAQPQLRDALFELINPGSVPTTTATKDGALPTASSVNNLERTVHAVLNSPVGQAFGKAIEEQLADENLNQIANVVGLPLPSTTAQLTSAHLTSNQLPSQGDASQRVARYAPLEQYESFRFSVPSTSPQPVHSQPTPAQPVPTQPAPAPSTYTMPTYQLSPLPGHQAALSLQYPSQQNQALQNPATQLAPNQWNIASANQSPVPPLNYNNWAPIHSAQTSYRDIYPPPYGTQSQWK